MESNSKGSYRRGTAFLLGSGDDQLLITARHLCNDELEEVLLLRHPGTNDGNATSSLQSESAWTSRRPPTSRFFA